ncbi:MAG: hypothetical protein HGA42_03785 [Nostocales cyanobacterium W4_Combined_metabat2_030]|jgi:hypothetical protein|nr:hypothetical protein [Nostocales cyanobacterium W4_Combined_metabat2_030]
MKNLAVTSVVVLGCFFSLPNPVYAVNYGGTYTGDAIVSPGTKCAASSYYLEMKVKGNRFETLVTRRGGREPNSQFRISGNIDSSGNLKPDVVGGYGSNLFFFGKIGSQNITGSSGGSTNKTRCVWTYTLSKKESGQCDFRPRPGEQLCFGASGSHCEGDPLHPTRKYDDSCTVNAFVTKGSIAHDKCCKANPDGYACDGWNVGEQFKSPNRLAPCELEWRQAVEDARLQRGKWELFGPYYQNR